MKFILFLFFALVHLMLILSSPEGTVKLKYLKVYGLAVPGTLLLAVLAMFAIKFSGVYPSVQTRTFFFAILMSILALILSNGMVIIGNYLTDLMLNYHHAKSGISSEQAQVKFVVRNRQLIGYALKGIFLFATFWGLYGIWFGKK